MASRVPVLVNNLVPEVHLPDRSSAHITDFQDAVTALIGGASLSSSQVQDFASAVVALLGPNNRPAIVTYTDGTTAPTVADGTLVLALTGTVAPVFSVLTANSDLTDATSYQTDTVTPTAGRVLYLHVVSNTAGAAALPATVTGLGMTWSLVSSSVDSATNQAAALYRATSGTPTTGKVTIGYAAAQGNCAWRLVEASRVAATPTQVATPYQGASTSPIANFATAIGSGHAVLAFYACQSQQQTATVATGYTELGAQVASTPPSFRTSAEFSLTPPANPSWAASSTAPKSILAVELTPA